MGLLESLSIRRPYPERSLVIFLDNSLSSRKKKPLLIRPSGWTNTQDPILLREGEYAVPYSSHSNFSELEKFVASIRPAVLKGVNPLTQNPMGEIRDIKYFHQYSFVLQKIKQRGYDLFQQLYVRIETASPEYKLLLSPAERGRLNSVLGLELTEAEINKDDTRHYKTQTFARMDIEEAMIHDPSLMPQPAKRPEPKEKVKNMKIDRMIKQQSRDAAEQKKKLFGNKKVNPNLLVDKLFSSSRAASLERESVANSTIGMNAIEEMLKANQQRLLAREDQRSKGSGGAQE